MKKINKDVLKETSHNLLFDMEEEQYDVFLSEFDIFFKHMEIIANLKGVDEVEPMIFPYPVSATYLREDVVNEKLSREEALKNAHDVKDGVIIIPKVVG